MKPFGKALPLIFLISFLMFGCAKTAPSADAAITHSKTLKNKNVQMMYLVGQAESFLKMDKNADAAKVADYILSEIDPESMIAQSIAKRAELGLD